MQTVLLKIFKPLMFLYIQKFAVKLSWSQVLDPSSEWFKYFFSYVMFLLVVLCWISMFGKWHTFSIRFKLRLSQGIRNTTAIEFSMGNPSCRNHFSLGLLLLLNMGEKCSQTIFVIVPRDVYQQFGQNYTLVVGYSHHEMGLLCIFLAPSGCATNL